jgi:hypothetical protein
MQLLTIKRRAFLKRGLVTLADIKGRRLDIMLGTTKPLISLPSKGACALSPSVKPTP